MSPRAESCTRGHGTASTPGECAAGRFIRPPRRARIAAFPCRASARLALEQRNSTHARKLPAGGGGRRPVVHARRRANERAGDRAHRRHADRRQRRAALPQHHHRDRERPHPRDRPFRHGLAAARRRRRRPRRQVRDAGHHQWPRPCRAAAARSAAAPIRALRRDHHDQHVFRPGRRRRIQGQTEGRRPARRAPAHGEIPLHVAALHPRLGGEDAGGRPRQGRRDRRQGRRLREGVDRRPGRPPPQALARVLRRRARAGAQARPAHHGARGRARRRKDDRRRGRQHPRPQRARPARSRTTSSPRSSRAACR